MRVVARGSAVPVAVVLLVLLLLPLAGARPALAQGNSDACHNQYGACMERCSTRPASLQESCSNSCESTTNVCYGEMYGPGKAAQTVQPAPEASAQATEAGEARDEAKPAKVKKKKH